MATLQVIVADTLVPRIRTAFGHFNNDTPPVWVDATVQEVQDALKAFMRSKVIDYETTQNAIADRATKSQEVW